MIDAASCFCRSVAGFCCSVEFMAIFAGAHLTILSGASLYIYDDAKALRIYRSDLW